MKERYSLILTITIAMGILNTAIAASESEAMATGSAEIAPESKEEKASRNEAEEKVAIPRDPFWPFGYNPLQDVIGTQEEQTQQLNETEQEKALLRKQWREAQEKIKVSGLTNMGQGDYYAIINGEMLAEGDTVTIEHANARFIWRIKEIDSQGVKFERVRVRIRKSTK